MKSKVTEWGNSNGIRITSAMMAHLNVEPGEELELKLTSKGIEIVKNIISLDGIKNIKEEFLQELYKNSEPVKVLSDPYAETDAAYIVISLNPCQPEIREVAKGAPDSYTTLADAKEAARQIVQAAIAEAKDSLGNIRQLGIDDISYIAL